MKELMAVGSKEWDDFVASLNIPPEIMEEARKWARGVIADMHAELDEFEARRGRTDQ